MGIRRLPVHGRDVLLPLGPRLVAACSIGPGMRVLDVAAGTGNASIPAAERGASVTASDLTPELLHAVHRRAEAERLELEWVEADAENLPFEDESFDVVMSSIGAMFAPHHQDVADELVRDGLRKRRLGADHAEGPSQADFIGGPLYEHMFDPSARLRAAATCA